MPCTGYVEPLPQGAWAPQTSTLASGWYMTPLSNRQVSPCYSNVFHCRVPPIALLCMLRFVYNVNELIERPSWEPCTYMQAKSIPAHVPGTVLSNLIANNNIPDPNVGLHHHQIPDIYHAARDFYTYEWTTSFLKPANWDCAAGCTALLTLHGICYTARCPQARDLHSPCPGSRIQGPAGMHIARQLTV